MPGRDRAKLFIPAHQNVPAVHPENVSEMKKMAEHKRNLW
jgi:hypothetical protein